MLRKSKGKVFLRPVTMEDAHTLFNWSNDPETRKNSFSSEPILWENHLEWLGKKLKSETSNLYILSNGVEEIGTIRLDFSKVRKIYLISYSIGSQFQGKGYGTEILSLIEDEAREKKRQGVDVLSLIGEVKQDNYASIRCFEKNDYLLQSEDELEKIFCKIL